jgi:hypothetical protein
MSGRVWPDGYHLTTRAKALHAAGSPEATAYVYVDFAHRASSWYGERRILAKAQHTPLGSDERFVVTSLDAPSHEVCAFSAGSGQMENWSSSTSVPAAPRPRSSSRTRFGSGPTPSTASCSTSCAASLPSRCETHASRRFFSSCCVSPLASDAPLVCSGCGSARSCLRATTGLASPTRSSPDSVCSSAHPSPKDLESRAPRRAQMRTPFDDRRRVRRPRRCRRAPQASDRECIGLGPVFKRLKAN